MAATAVATTRIVTPTTPASVSRTAKSGGSQPPHIAIRDTTCEEHHCQLPGHRVPLRWLSSVLPDVCIVPAALSHCSDIATPLVRSTQVWAYFRMLFFTLVIYGSVRTIHPAPSPANNPRQPVPLVVNAVATIFRVESAMIAFLPRATAATMTTTSAATAWPADNHCGKNPWTLHADRPIQHYQRQAIYSRDEVPASTLKERAPPTPPPPNNLPPRPAPYMRYRLSKPDPLVLAMVLRCGSEEAKTSSPTGMLHSTPSTDEQRYLPKTTATSGSGLQRETSASNSGPSHPEPASPIDLRLHPRSS